MELRHNNVLSYFGSGFCYISPRWQKKRNSALNTDAKRRLLPTFRRWPYDMRTKVWRLPEIRNVWYTKPNPRSLHFFRQSWARERGIFYFTRHSYQQSITATLNSLVGLCFHSHKYLETVFLQDFLLQASSFVPNRPKSGYQIWLPVGVPNNSAW